MSIQYAKENIPVGAVIVGEYRGLRIQEGISQKTQKPYRMAFAVIDTFGLENVEIQVSEKDESDFKVLEPRKVVVVPIQIASIGFNQQVRYSPRAPA